MPQRALILVLAVTVIVISLIAQGLTLEPLVRRTAAAQPPVSTRQQEARARLQLAEAGVAGMSALPGSSTTTRSPAGPVWTGPTGSLAA